MHTGMHTWTETFQIWFVPRSRCSHVRAVQKIPLQTTNCTAASFQHMPLYPAGFEAEASAAGCHDRAARRPALIAACHQVTYSACKVTRRHLSPANIPPAGSTGAWRNRGVFGQPGFPVCFEGFVSCCGGGEIEG